MFLKQIIGTAVCVLFNFLISIKWFNWRNRSRPKVWDKRPWLTQPGFKLNDFVHNSACMLLPVWLSYVVPPCFLSFWSSLFHLHLTYKACRVMPWKVSFAKNVRLFFAIILWDWSRSTSKCNQFNLAGYVYLRLVILSKSTVAMGGNRNFRSGYRSNFPPFCLRFSFCYFRNWVIRWNRSW